MPMENGLGKFVPFYAFYTKTINRSQHLQNSVNFPNAAGRWMLDVGRDAVAICYMYAVCYMVCTIWYMPLFAG